MFEDKEERTSVDSIIRTIYLCSECHATFCTTNSTSVSNCVLCGSSNITNQDEVEEKKPFVIPFTKGIQDAQLDYRRKIRFNPLIPISFRKKKTVQSIQKVYLPAFLANVNVKGSTRFLGGEKEKIMKDKQKCIETKKYDVLQNINVDYKNVLLNTFSGIDDKLFNNICECNYNNLKEFNIDLFKDSFYVVGDIAINEIAEKGRQRILKYSVNVARESVVHTLKKLEHDDLVASFSNTKEILVPVYILNISYKGKKYMYLMNGENGLSSFQIPFGILEMVLFGTFCFAILFFISFLIAYFL